MTESEAPPQELPDTPSTELDTKGFGDLVAHAEEIASYRRDRDHLEELEDRVAKVLLAEMEKAGLNGISLPDGVKVRRRSRTTYGKIDPVKLAGVLADAPSYTIVRVEVDKDRLLADYPNVAFELGKPKTSTFHVVAFPKAKKEAPS